MRGFDRTGLRFGRVMVIRRDGKKHFPSGRMQPTWLCRCDCGREFAAVACALDRGSVKSCGCLYAETRASSSVKHGANLGGAPTSEYRAWQSMKSRCYRSGDKSFQHYGGRGIQVCRRWLDGEDGKSGFECFLADVGRKPSPMLTIDRIDVDGDYEPGNVRWATYSQQNANRRPYKRAA